MTKLLPPEQLPPLPDPAFGNRPGPYAHSELRRVVGTRINPDAIGWYKRRDLLTSPMCAAKTCAHPELEGWLGDVGSFDPQAKITQPSLSQWPFTGVVPRISVSANERFPLAPATYMIDYAELNSNPTAVATRPWVENLKDRFPEGTDLILSFFGNRNLVLGLWTQRDFWYAPFLTNFKAIILPDFSAFADDPRPQSLFGERMQQIFGQEGSAAGHNIIPSIAWMDESSLRRQIALWCSQAPHVNTIFLDAYGAGVDRTLWNWRWLFAIEKYCSNKPYIRWMIAGITAGWAIRELNRIFPEGNYCLVPSVSLFVNSTSKTTDRAYMGVRYRRKLQGMEDFKAGRIVADLAPRPDHWPMFAEALRLDE